MKLAGIGTFELKETDSTFVKNGEFHIEGSVPDGPRLYWLDLGRHHDGKVIRLFINNNEKITISGGNINDIQHSLLEHWVKIDGSASNYAWHMLIPAEQTYLQSRNVVENRIKEIVDSVGFDRNLINELYSVRDKFAQALFGTHFFSPEPDAQAAIPLNFYYGLFESTGHASFFGQRLTTG